ncbi:MAG: hypothetical protein WDA59_07155 [Methanofastidiosum sp.]
MAWAVTYGKRQWYVCYGRNLHNLYVQYCQNKKEAEKLLKKILKVTTDKYPYCYMESMWKNDVKNYSFSKLHGKSVVKTDNILSFVT